MSFYRKPAVLAKGLYGGSAGAEAGPPRQCTFPRALLGGPRLSPLLRGVLRGARLLRGARETGGAGGGFQPGFEAGVLGGGEVGVVRGQAGGFGAGGFEEREIAHQVGQA